MIGEIAVCGVFIPTLVLVGIAALILCGALATLLSTIGFYRLILHRPIVDIALFFLLFAALAQVSGIFGSRS